MARDLGLDEVVDHFTLVGDELDLLRNKSGATRLGFAALMKFLLWRGRFPRAAHELPDDAVAHLARQVRVPAGELASFEFASRTAQRHRSEIRAYTGFRECSVIDAETLASWLAELVAPRERRPERVREELIARCRAELIEPPTPDRVTEIVRSALYQAEQALLKLIAERVAAAAVARLEALITVSDDEDEDVLSLIKAAPGNVSLDTMLVEISKLEAIRAVGLPADLFAGIAPNVIAGWRARAMVESPSHLREHPQPTKLALLCALLYTREQEVTDSLAQLLISTVHRINAHAEEKVIAELVKDYKRVTGKETLLRKIAEASLDTPDDTVREVIYPVVGGEATLPTGLDQHVIHPLTAVAAQRGGQKPAADPAKPFARHAVCGAAALEPFLPGDGAAERQRLEHAHRDQRPCQLLNAVAARVVLLPRLRLGEQLAAGREVLEQRAADNQHQVIQRALEVRPLQQHSVSQPVQMSLHAADRAVDRLGAEHAAREPATTEPANLAMQIPETAQQVRDRHHMLAHVLVAAA